ncbi:MAG: hypothetical protein H6980_12290 [Gammaproteobacteria bacterium]|nr:hypothetical protein [Gammaproteobacteria bacterium]
MNEELEVQIRRVLQHFDHAVAETNRERFAEHIGDVKREDFARVASVIAELRARYMKVVLDAPSPENMDHLGEWAGKVHKYRLAYTEVMSGFTELRHALERGYFSIVD